MRILSLVRRHCFSWLYRKYIFLLYEPIHIEDIGEAAHSHLSLWVTDTLLKMSPFDCGRAESHSAAITLNIFIIVDLFHISLMHQAVYVKAFFFFFFFCIIVTQLCRSLAFIIFVLLALARLLYVCTFYILILLVQYWVWSSFLLPVFETLYEPMTI